MQELSISDLAGIINNAPSGKTVRLLSCNDLNAAKELSRLTTKPFYASDGWVELYQNGEVRSANDFYLFQNGQKSTTDKILANQANVDDFESIRLGARSVIATFYKTEFPGISDKIAERLAGVKNLQNIINNPTASYNLKQMINALDNTTAPNVRIGATGNTIMLTQRDAFLYDLGHIFSVGNTKGGSLRGIVEQNTQITSRVIDNWKALIGQTNNRRRADYLNSTPDELADLLNPSISTSQAFKDTAQLLFDLSQINTNFNTTLKYYEVRQPFKDNGDLDNTQITQFQL